MEILIENSKAKWVNNDNYPNNWTLEKTEFILGKRWGLDRNITRVYGSVQEVLYGENIGKFEARVPYISDNDEDGDTEILGYFDTPDEARLFVLENNFPDYSCRYW